MSIVRANDENFLDAGMGNLPRRGITAEGGAP
jgi:hypothetical protein